MSKFEIGSMVRITRITRTDEEAGVRAGMIGKVVGEHKTTGRGGREGWFVKFPGVTAPAYALEDEAGNLVFWGDQLLPVSASDVVDNATGSFKVGDWVVISAYWTTTGTEAVGVITHVEPDGDWFEYSVRSNDGIPGGGRDRTWICPASGIKHAPKPPISARIEAHYETLGNLRRDSKQANEHLVATRQALRDAEKQSEEAFKAQADAENVMRELLDEAVGIEWQSRAF
ncbi:hypothetical protein [Xanthomonas phage DMF5-T1]|nr:hypothetical protein [Xanthomonas phage DMF5-T1]